MTSVAKTAVCNACGLDFDRNRMVTKRVQYRTWGPNGRTVRLRTVSHLCMLCASSEDDWNKESHSRVKERPAGA